MKTSHNKRKPPRMEMQQPTVIIVIMELTKERELVEQNMPKEAGVEKELLTSDEMVSLIDISCTVDCIAL